MSNKWTKVPTDLRKAWLEYIHQFSDWNTAITCTFKRIHLGQVVSRKHMSEATHHFLRRVDSLCLGTNKVKKGACLPSVVVYGWGTYDSNPHVHLAVTAPIDRSEADFFDLVEEAASKTQWFDRQRKVEPYRSAGWSSYMVDHHPENLDLDLLRDGMKGGGNKSI